MSNELAVRIVPVKYNIPGWEGKVVLPPKKHMHQVVLRTTLDTYSASYHLGDEVRFYHQCSPNAADKRRKSLVAKRDTIYAMVGANTFLTNIQLDGDNVCVIYMVPALLYSPGKTIDAWRRAQYTSALEVDSPKVSTFSSLHATKASQDTQDTLHQVEPPLEAKGVEEKVAPKTKAVQAKASPEAKAVEVKVATKTKAVQAKASPEAKARPTKELSEAKATHNVQDATCEEQDANQEYQDLLLEEQCENNISDDELEDIRVANQEYRDSLLEEQCEVLDEDFEEAQCAGLGDYDGYISTKTSKGPSQVKDALGEPEAKVPRKVEVFPSRKSKQDDKKGEHKAPRSGRNERKKKHVPTSKDNNKTVRNKMCDKSQHKTKSRPPQAQTPHDNEEPRIESLGHLGVAPKKRKMQDMAKAVARAQEELAAYHAQYLFQQRKFVRLATMLDALVEEY